jgi:ABC-type thiamine transport system ATPase subunit
VNRFELTEVGGRDLVRADLELGPGLYTVVALTPEGAEELVRIAAGVTAPRRGTVLIDGKNPYSRPEARRRIGSLFAIETVTEARTVDEWIARALRLRGSSVAPASVLEAIGLPALGKRRPMALSPGDARGVALGMALAVGEGAVILLVEPLATSAGRARVVTAIAEAARADATVVCMTASLRDASDIGGRCFPLRFGRIGGDTSVQSLAARGDSEVEMIVRTDDPRRLSAALSMDAAFSHVRSDFDTVPGEVAVSGGDSERIALAVLRGARESGANILALSQRPVRSSAAGSRS